LAGMPKSPKSMATLNLVRLCHAFRVCSCCGGTHSGWVSTFTPSQKAGQIRFSPCGFWAHVYLVIALRDYKTLLAASEKINRCKCLLHSAAQTAMNVL
jgi:hypothetical protein